MNTTLKIFSLIVIIAFTVMSCSSEDDSPSLGLEGSETPYLGLRLHIDSLRNEMATLKLPTQLVNRTEPRVQNLVTLLNAFKSEFIEKTNYITIPETTTVVSKEETFMPDVDTSETHTWLEGGNTIKFTILDKYVSYNFSYEIIGADGVVLENKMSGVMYHDSNTVREATLFPYENGVEQPRLNWFGRDNSTVARIIDGSEYNEYEIREDRGSFSYYTDAVYNTSEKYTWTNNGDSGNYDNIDDDTEDMFWF